MAIRDLHNIRLFMAVFLIDFWKDWSKTVEFFLPFLRK